MATIDGTVTGVALLHGSPSGKGERKFYLVNAKFATYTGSSDDARIQNVHTEIANRVRNGKTLTCRGALAGPAGQDAAGQAVYAGGAITNTSGTLTFNLAVAAGTEITATTGVSEGVGVIVAVDES
jgi:hypothetical protein